MPFTIRLTEILFFLQEGITVCKDVMWTVYFQRPKREVQHTVVDVQWQCTSETAQLSLSLSLSSLIYLSFSSQFRFAVYTKISLISFYTISISFSISRSLSLSLSLSLSFLSLALLFQFFSISSPISLSSLSLYPHLSSLSSLSLSPLFSQFNSIQKALLAWQKHTFCIAKALRQHRKWFTISEHLEKPRENKYNETK